MKYIILAIFLLTVPVQAGNTCFTTTAGEDARIVAAVGGILGLGRDATQAEVKAYVTSHLSAAVSDYERRKNMQNFTPSPTINPQ